jgi:hypothetical protein
MLQVPSFMSIAEETSPMGVNVCLQWDILLLELGALTEC